MMTRSIVLPLSLSLLAPFGLLFQACAVDDVEPTAVAESVDLRAGDELTLRGDLELLRDGLRGVASDADFTALAHESILAAAENGEYELTLSELAATAAELDLSLSDRITAGVLEHGGSDDDASRAVALIDGFEVDGVAVAPTLYVPHLDESYFGLGPWEAPELLSTVVSFDGDELVAVELAGPELLVSEDMINMTAAWFVSYRVSEGDDPSPKRLFARCWCVQTNPGSGGTVGVTCATGGSATTIGRCGRTGLFGNNCNGSCGAAQG